MGYRRGDHLINDTFFFRAASFLFFDSLWPLMHFVMKAMYGTKFHNLDILRKCSGGVIVSNHTTPLDPVTMSSLVRPHRMFHTLLEATVETPVLGTIIQLLGGVPVPRGRNGIERFTAACALAIKRRKYVHIYPEGECYIYNQQVKPFHRGAFHVAAVLHKPVIPVAQIMQTGPFKPFSLLGRSVPKMKIVVLNPVYPDQFDLYGKNGTINEEKVKEFASYVHDLIQAEIDRNHGTMAFCKGHMERIKGVND